MCLCRIDYRDTERIRAHSEREIRCWKVFRKSATGMLRPAFSKYSSEVMPVGTWIPTCNEVSQRAYGGIPPPKLFIYSKRGLAYPAGFHGSTREYAEALAKERRFSIPYTTFVVREVILRGVETVGRQYMPNDWRPGQARRTCRTWVAREMFVLPEPPTPQSPC